MWQPDHESLLRIFLLIITVPFAGGAIAGIIYLILIKRDNLFVEIFLLLVGAIGGYEAFVLLNIYSSFPKNIDEMLRVIIVSHTNLGGFSWPAILGATGACTALFMNKWIVHSRQ